MRKDWLVEGFNHWRKLAYVGYPKPRPTKLICGLKLLAKEIRLLKVKEDTVMAAKRDWFADRYCVAERV